MCYRMETGCAITLWILIGQAAQEAV